MELKRTPLTTINEAEDKRREPGSVPWPKGHGSYARDPSKKLLPGDVSGLSKQQLGHRSHQQRLARTNTRVVTFSNGIAKKNVSVIESTPKRAAAKARAASRLDRGWKVIAVDGKPFSG